MRTKEKCWYCGNEIKKVRIAAQHGNWCGIFCTEACLLAYSKNKENKKI